MAAKELRFNEEARRGLQAGVDKLADTVKHIDDDGLRASLERLGATILGKKR